MPYDSQGNFYRVHNWEQDRLSEIEIVSDRHDEEDDNFAEGLSNCVHKDGRTPMLGHLNLNNFRIQNVANGTGAKDAVNKSQLDAKANSNEVVKLSGSQTIGGTKTFTSNVVINRSLAALDLKNTDLAKGTTPTTASPYCAVNFKDKNGNTLGDLLYFYNNSLSSAKETGVSLRAYKANAASDSDIASLIIAYPASGNPLTRAPASDVNNSIVTTVSKSKATNGYFQLGNGLIINWGKVTADGNNYVTITFPKAFSSSSSYSITATQRSTSTSLASMSAVSIVTPTATSIKVACRAITAASTIDYFYWIAIGY